MINCDAHTNIMEQWKGPHCCECLRLTQEKLLIKTLEDVKSELDGFGHSSGQVLDFCCRLSDTIRAALARATGEVR